MKTIQKTISKASLLLGVILVFASCESWNLNGIKGEGAVVDEEVVVSEVQGIVLEIPATVYLTQGDNQSIEIEAQQNILDNIEKSVYNDALRLKFDKDVSKCEPIKVYMTIKSLSLIDIRGSGDVSSDSGFEGGDFLDINISGSGDISVDANAKDVGVNISGSGDVHLSTVCEDIFGTISGSGEITLNGSSSNYADFKINGSGDILAFNFPSKSCKVNSTGSGGAKVDVSDALTVRIAGSGDVFYRGSPSLSVSIVGSGDVINAN